MPLVTVTVVKPTPPQRKDHILSVVHAALVAAGVPPTDRFQRIIELEPQDFRFDATYPDLGAPRTRDFVLIEILFSVGRSVKVKRGIVNSIVTELPRDTAINPEHVMVVFKETAWENWSFGGGRILHA